jgi:hypothetical protein
LFKTVQADSPFWNRKKKKVPASKPRAAKAAPAQKKNKPAIESETVTRGGSPAADDESEVKLDSLARLFIELANTSHSQGDAENSRADDVEVISISSDSDTVISISSDSDTFVPQRPRKTVRKVSFSHPLAYLDPKFSLKKSQHADSVRRHTRSGSGELLAGLPDVSAARKRRNEVPHSPTPSHPLAGLFKQPLNPSDSDYQESPPSPGNSSATQLPPLVIKQG